MLAGPRHGAIQAHIPIEAAGRLAALNALTKPSWLV